MKAALALVLLLGACGGVPEPIYRPVEVRVPITMPCEIPDVSHPVWATLAVPLNASTFDKVRAALIELKQRAAYEASMAAAIKACQIST